MTMWMGWIIAGILLIWFLFIYRRSHTKLLKLNSYIIYLLLDDKMRENHKVQLTKFIKASNQTSFVSLAREAFFALEDIVDSLADDKTPALPGTTSMIWFVKRGN